MQSSTQGRQVYQGYPYVNPVVTDVPSVDPATANRWANLPRRPYNANPGPSGSGQRVVRPGPSAVRPGHSVGPMPGVFRPGVTVIRPAPSVVSPVTNTAGYPSGPQQTEPQPTPASPPKKDIDSNPVVYIDLPEGDSQVSQSAQCTPENDQPDFVQGPQQTEPQPTPASPPKKDIDSNPVVYIDLPEGGSQVSQSAQCTPENDQPDFVQDTIMYDPFENRRIDAPKEDNGSELSIESNSTTSEEHTGHTTWTRPNPPNTLNLGSPGSSSAQSPASRPTSQMPGFMTKESLVYGGNSNSFPMTPIPMSEFPEPPPAYTESAASPVSSLPTAGTPASSTQVSTPTQGTQMGTQQEIPPRTQVILPKPQVVMPSYGQPIYGAPRLDRKNMTCHHCGMRVHTLAIKEVGYMTHFIACLTLILFIPLVFLVYCTDAFKHKNHYCPNCNKRIAYEMPFFGDKLHYDS